MGVPGSAAAGRDKAPLSAAQAVTIILDGVRSGSWRIRSARTKTIEVCDRCDEFRGAEASQGACETPWSGRTPRPPAPAPSWAGWRHKRPRQQHRSGSPPHMPR